MRFALLELKVTSVLNKNIVNCNDCALKVAVVMIVRHLQLLPGTKTLKPLQFDKDHSFAWVQGGLWAKVKKRELDV